MRLACKLPPEIDTTEVELSGRLNEPGGSDEAIPIQRTEVGKKIN